MRDTGMFGDDVISDGTDAILFERACLLVLGGLDPVSWTSSERRLRCPQRWQRQTVNATINGVYQPLINPQTCDLPLAGDTFFVNGFSY